MSAEIVNPVPASELSGWSANLLTTFLQVPEPEVAARGARYWSARLEPDRTWGARANGRWVATLGTEARQFTVPGPDGGTTDVAVDALTGVTVNATHRRQGLLSGMLGAALDAAAERGDALSVLLAAEWPIYGRFGYGPAGQSADYTFRTRAPGAAITADPAGAVRQVEPDELIQLGPAIFEQARRLRPGQVDRPAFWWDRFCGDPRPDERFVAIVHETGGVADGLLAWKPGESFELDGGRGAIEVSDLVAGTPVAERNLWAYLSGMDLIAAANLRHRPVDETARWLLADGRTLRQTDAADYLWVKFLDVPAALSARAYATEDDLVLDVVDPSAHGNAAGRFRLEAGLSSGRCTRTRRRADLRLPAPLLASGYLGGYALTPRRAEIEELTPGALRRLDAALTVPLAPYCATGF